MGASKHKKIRQEERLGQDSKPKNKKNSGRKIPPAIKRIIGIVAATLIVVILGTTILTISGVAQKIFPAAKIGDENITLAEYNYNYAAYISSFMSQYNQYLSVLKLDSAKPFSSQKSSFDEKLTWAQYFEEQTFKALQLNVSLANKAKEEGIVLNAEDVESINSYLNAVKENSQSQNSSLNDYIKSVFGSGNDIDTLKSALERGFLAERYRQTKMESYKFTEDDIVKYYNENKADFDLVTYRMFYVANANSTDPTNVEAAKAEAKKKADEMMGAVTDENSFKELAVKNAAEADKINYENNADPTYNADKAKGEISPSDAANWFFADERKNGDKTVVEADAGSYVLYYISRKREDYNTVDVRHILVKFELNEGSTVSTDAQKAAAKAKADVIYEEWKKAGSTEEVFSTIAKDKSEDTGSATNGGLYEAVAKNDMVQQFNDWIFDASRKVGDTGIVETSYGYHIMYYKGTNKPTWQKKADEKLLETTYTSFVDELKGKNPIKKNAISMFFVDK